MTELARRSLLPLALLSFAATAWLSRIVLLETGLLDVTLPKLLLGVALVVLLAARPWQLATRFDRRALFVLAALAAWLVLGSAVRGDSADLKRTLGAVGFGAVALAFAWAAVRTSGERGARWIAISICVFAVVSFAAALLELATWDVGDPFRWLWDIARPQSSYVEGAGISVILQTHSMGADKILRVSGLSWHPNILAMSLLMPAALSLALAARGVAERRTAQLIASAVVFGLVATTIVWTQSRSAFIGLVLVLAASTAVAWLAQRERSGEGKQAPQTGRWTWLAPLALGVPLIALSLALDSSIIERLLGSLTPAVARLPTGQVSTADNAADVAAVHLEMIATGLRIMVARPLDLIAGPGLAAYTIATHDPASPDYLKAALGVPDPNSFWLSFALGGGLVGVLLILGVVAVTWFQLGRAWRVDLRQGLDWTWRHFHRAWLLAWIPAWVLVENVGGNPLEVAEMIPFAMLVGLSIAFVAQPSAPPTQPAPG